MTSSLRYSISRDVASSNFWWDVRGCSANTFSLRPTFSDSSLAMVLGSVNCPAEVRCTTFLALQNGKFSSELRDYSIQISPTRFVTEGDWNFKTVLLGS